jgi:CRISP-associated protein Cas1
MSGSTVRGLRSSNGAMANGLGIRTFTAALAIVGLDPWKGLYHVERPGRPALALDLIELFRPVLADSAVLMALNNAEIGPSDWARSSSQSSVGLW